MTEAAPTDAGAEVYSLLADGASPKSFEVALQRHHGNPGATLHGGCGTMLLEAAASASYCAERGVAAIVEEVGGRFVVLRASDRKVLKPPGYSRPELRAILAAAGATPEALGEQTRV